MLLALDLVLFFGVTLGLALPTVARLPNWEPALRLSTGVAAALIVCALSMFLVYDANLSRELLWALPAAAISSLVFHRRTIRAFARDPALRTALLAWLAIAAGAMIAQALVISYSGGGWAVDWVEHYDRALFFVKGWPTDTLFLGAYPLPSRPPVGNLIVAAFECVGGSSIAHYQVFATLLSSTAFLPALALAWRFDSKGPRTRTALLITLFFLVSPVWMENVTFPWTKLPAVFFALLGIALIAPRDEPDARPWRFHLGWLMLAVGFLVHYSIGPWIVAALAGLTLQRRSEWRSRTFWRDYLVTGVLCGGLILSSLSWSASHFGWKETLDSNTAIAGASTHGAAAQGSAILHNLYHTIVPHFFRSFDKGLINQHNALGMLRDQFFNLYQVNVLFLCGSAGLAALAWLLTRRERTRSPRRVFWTVTVFVAIVVGIAVHSPPDEWGLAQICLQPLALLGLAVVAAGFDSIPTLLRRLVAFLFAADFALGVGLQFLIQSFALGATPHTAASDVAYSSSLNLIANVNLLWKEDRNLVFLGDHARPFQGMLAVAAALLLTLLITFLMRRDACAPDTPARRPAAWLGWGLVAALGALLALTALRLLMSTYMMYDDEGYVLYSLHNFSLHGGLYDRVFSQYGPFYYVLLDGLHRLGWAITNTGARLLNFFEWMGACAFCAAVVWQATRRTLAAAAALALSFIYLWPMISEPSHPGGFICLVVAMAGYAGARVFDRPRSVMAALGAAAAALLLTKINVGIFLVAGVGAWWALHARLPFSRRATWIALGILMTLMTAVLVKTLITESWVLIYLLVVSASSWAVLLAGRNTPQGRLAPSSGAWAFGALGVVALATTAAVLARGTTLQGLLDGVILDPLRMPLDYTGPVIWRTGAPVFAVVSLALAAVLPRLPERMRFWTIVAGRLTSGAVFLLSWASLVEMNQHAFALSFGLASAWFFVAPLRDDDSGLPLRLWLALLLVPESLHAYPVAGSQISWGTFLWVPLAVIGLWDAVDALRSRLAQRIRPAISAIALVSVAVVAVRVASFASMARNRASEGEPLGLPGAENLVLPENFTSALHVLAKNVDAHASVLFSLPGMYSFNLWTGVPTPTLQDATHWFTLLSAAKQAEIGRVLTKSPRACVIVQRSIYDFLQNRHIATESPLTRLIKREFTPAFSIGTYEFWVHRGRSIAELGTARIFEGTDPTAPRYRLSLTLSTRGLHDVAGVEFRLFNATSSTPIMLWNGANARAYLTQVTDTGASAGPSREVQFPFSATGTFRLDLLMNSYPQHVLADNSIVYLVDHQGRRLAEARFVY